MANISVLLWLARNPGICVENKLVSREAQASVAMPTFTGTFNVDASDGCTSKPNFFMSFMTTLNDTVTNPCVRTLVAETKEKQIYQIKLIREIAEPSVFVMLTTRHKLMNKFH